LWFDNILKKQEFIFSTAYIGLGQYLFIIETSYSDEYLQKYLREQCDFGSDNLRIQLGISKSFCSFADIKSAYREAKHAILDSFILGSKMIYKHNDGNDEKLSEIVQKISSITSLIQLRAILENIINDINNYLSLNIDNCCKLHNEIRMQFKRLTNKNDYFEYLVPDSIISNYESFVDMLKSFIEQIDLDNGRGNTNISSKLLKEILNYINENFEKKIQLFAIAKMFFINPNYLSQLFKTNLNTSFTDYVTNLKIEKAKQLIENSDLTMCEISEQVGYDDYFHFSKVFKKKMDVSPSSFKKNKIN
jgi:two-component system response regulator YesN